MRHLMKILGIIPARGGSKRLPRKNIVDLGGKPLLQWTIDAAKESKIFNSLYVSTEDEEIGKIAGDLWWRRDPLLAKDSTPSWDVLMDVYKNCPADIIVLLQPTSPFRTANDIIEATKLFNVMNAEAVISVTDGSDDLAFQLRWANRLEKIPNVKVANGAYYGITKEAIENGDNFYSGRFYGYLMPKSRSLDIDTEMDLEIARFIVKNGIYSEKS